MNQNSGVPRAAVVIATHAIGRLYLDALVRTLSDEYDAVHLITFFNGPLLPADVVEGLRSIGVIVRQYGPTAKLDRFRQLATAHRYLRGILRAGPSDVFVANPNEALTNWLAFDDKARTDLGASLKLVPEGISNFYLATVQESDRQSTLYRVGTRALGIRLRENRELVLGLGEVPYEEYWYAGSAGLMPGYMPTRRFDVPKPKPAQQFQAGTWLFLGQSQREPGFDGAYGDVLRAVVRASEGAVHYKPHPHEALTDDELAALAALGIEIVQTGESSEQLSLSYSTVAGILSSTLLNLAMLGWHGDTRAVFDLDSLQQLTGRPAAELQQVVSALREAGVKPLEGVRSNE